MMETIGQRVRRLREDKNISRKELANRVGLSYTGLASLEDGKAKSSTKLHQIAEVLGETPFFLETGRVARAQSIVADDPFDHARLDVGIVRDVGQALENVFINELRRPYSLAEHPELFVEVYERLAKHQAGAYATEVAVWLGRVVERIAQQGAHDGNEPGTDG